MVNAALMVMMMVVVVVLLNEADEDCAGMKRLSGEQQKSIGHSLALQSITVRQGHTERVVIIIQRCKR